MQAAQAGREEEVLDLLLSLVASLGQGRTDAAPNGGQHAQAAAGGHLQQQAAGGGEDEGAPRSLETVDRAARSSLLDAGGEQQQLQQASSGSSSTGGSAGGFAAVDVRRWTFDYSTFRKLRRLGAGSFGEASVHVHAAHHFVL